MNKEVYFQKELKKRLSLVEGWYSCPELTELCNTAFAIGIQYSFEWRNPFIEQPDNGMIVVIRKTFNRYHVCQYENGEYRELCNNKILDVTNQDLWKCIE